MTDNSGSSQDRHKAIWLKVSEVRLHNEDQRCECQVRLVGDCEDPRLHWWPVDDKALSGTGAEKGGFKIYKAILHELDKKRLVIARLAWENDHLECKALRFQSPDLTGP